MPQTEDYLISLQKDENKYKDWLASKGVKVTEDETFTTLNKKAEENISNGQMPEEITENGEYDVTAYEKVNVNMIEPSGSIEITENGEFDVERYQNAFINVQPKIDGSLAHPFIEETTIIINVEADL